jgi:tetratricopeptide (TPR) repeat protein
VGIFKKILQRKEKEAENPPIKHGTKKKNAPGNVDPLAPLGTGQVQSPLPAAEDQRQDSALREERTNSNPPEKALKTGITDTAPHRGMLRGEGDVPETIPPAAVAGELGPVPRRVREAEQALANMERTLSEVSSLFTGTEALPRLKILLVEAKIKLAEADIKLSEAEIAPAGSRPDPVEIENRISLAEARIGEVEKILSSVFVPGSQKGSLSRLKIGVAGMKIRLAEIQIALAGSLLEGSGNTRGPSPDPVGGMSPPPPPKEIIPSDEGVIRMGIPDEPPTTRQADPPKQIRIHADLQEMGVLPESRNEPVRIKEEEPEPDNGSFSTPSDPGERIVLPDMEKDSSPFETGINLNRVHIRKEDAMDVNDPQAASQERVKIRSDERESAWVTEDGSLKIVSREKTTAENLREEEKPHISIRQPEVEKALIIEDLNRKGIDQRKKGEIEEALRSFDRVLELDPINEAALHNKGVALRSAGRYEEALGCFDRAQERDPDNPVILFNRGFCLGKLERFEEALKAFDRVLALRPEHSSGWFNKGKILQKMGRMEEAEEHLRKAQELGYP